MWLLFLIDLFFNASTCTAVGRVWIKWDKGGEFGQILRFFFFYLLSKVTLAVSKVRYLPHLPPLRYGHDLLSRGILHRGYKTSFHFRTWKFGRLFHFLFFFIKVYYIHWLPSNNGLRTLFRREIPISMSLSRVCFFTFPGKREMGMSMHCHVKVLYLRCSKHFSF